MYVWILNITICQLCYTRGTVIPCSLTLESRDVQVLDVLSASSSIVAVLKRRVRYYGAATAISTLENGWKDSFDDVSSAVWWLAEGRNEDLQTRHLEGEIRLPKEMKPTSAVGHFSVSVSSVHSSPHAIFRYLKFLFVSVRSSVMSIRCCWLRV